MNILITGKNSFIGSHFKNRYKEKFNIKEVDLENQSVSQIDMKDFDVVFHVAAIVHQSAKLPDDKYFRVNADLAHEVAVQAKKDGVGHFVLMSTVKVYGEKTNGKPWTEDTDPDPLDAYGKSKIEAERRLLDEEEENFTVSVVRTPVVYGPGVKANISNLIKLIDRVPVLPLGGIYNRRSMVYVGNLVSMVEAIIQKKAHGVFLAADKEIIPVTELVQNIADALEKKRIVFAMPSFLWKLIKIIKPAYYYRLHDNLEVNNEKTRGRLEWEPPYLFKDGINQTIAWFKTGKQ
ncbi:MAG: NAD-dependent epimerase/dehydratase family protein [Bacteroidota bacterium]